jgi:hypothetical protein
LVDVLGNDPKNWWRLYIDPKDRSDAEKTANDKDTIEKYKQAANNPGYLYDTQDSQGYQAAMIAAYQKYLTTVASIKDDRLVSWPTYLAMWTAAKEGVHGTDGPFTNRVDTKWPDKHELVRYQTSLDLPDEIIQQKLADKPLIREVGDDECMKLWYNWQYGDQKAPWGAHVLKIKSRCNVLSGPNQDLGRGIVELLVKFNGDMKTATTRGDQLKLIAGLIRTLHMLHIFSNGCGRTNIYMLLPALLLRYGFGLPLAQDSKNVHKWAQHFIFDGGFTDEYIAKYLWIMQEGHAQPQAPHPGGTTPAQDPTKHTTTPVVPPHTTTPVVPPHTTTPVVPPHTTQPSGPSGGTHTNLPPTTTHPKTPDPTTKGPQTNKKFMLAQKPATMTYLSSGVSTVLH